MQTVSFRFKGGKVVHAAVLQPIGVVAWQSLKFLEIGEISDVELPTKVVEMVAGSIAKARKGQVVLKDRRGTQKSNEQFQRGPDLFTKIYADMEQLSKSYARDEGKPRPMVLCDMAHGPGDSSTAMMQRVIASRSAGGSGTSADAEEVVFGFFVDQKELHHHVAKARRDETIKTKYADGTFKVIGFTPLPLPADVEAMEKEAEQPLAASMSTLTSVQRDGKHYLVIPEESALSFKLEGDLKRKFDQVKRDFPPPPPPKKLRSSAADSAGGSGEVPRGCFPMQQLLEKFLLRKSEPITVASQEFRVLQGESKASGAVHHFLHNHMASRRTIPAKTRLCSTSSSKYVNRKLDIASETGSHHIVWPWSLTTSTLFSFAFGADAPLTFGPVVGGGGTQVYAHNCSPVLRQIHLPLSVART